MVRAFAVLTLACVVATANVSAAAATSENTVKAAFVSKFPQFVMWPPSAWHDDDSLAVCVQRGASLAEALAGFAGADAVDGRHLIVRELDSTEDVRQCHVLVVASGDAASRILQRAASLPILTVGDYSGFLDDGGIIQLRMERGRVRFDVDAGAAARAGIRLSSQLLRLASTVRGARS